MIEFLYKLKYLCIINFGFTIDQRIFIEAQIDFLCIWFGVWYIIGNGKNSPPTPAPLKFSKFQKHIVVSSIHPKSNEIGFLDSTLASKLKVIKSQKSRTKLGTILHDKVPLFFLIHCFMS